MLFSKIASPQAFLKRGSIPTLKSFNQFLLFLSQSHKFKLIIHFVSQMDSNRIRGNSETRSMVTWALLRLRKYDEAEQFIDTHIVKSTNLSRARLWNALIRGLCVDAKDPEKALAVLRDCLKNRGILPSSLSFCSLIHGFSSRGDMGKAIEVLELMTEVKYPFDNFVCSSVISGFCRIGKPEFALRFFENAMDSGALRPNVVTYTALVGSLCKLGRVSEVEALICRMKEEGIEPDVVFYCSWICGYISEGLLNEVFKKNKEMVGKGIVHDTVSYTVLIDGFSKLGDAVKSVGFVEKMRDNGLEPNLITFTAIMSGLCRKGKLEEAFSVIKMVEDLGIEKDEFMYSTLIYGCCRSGDFDRVFYLLDEMEKSGIIPSLVTYNTLINGLCKFGRTAEADEVSKGFSGDTITYSTLLHGYVEEKSVTGIVETMRRLEDACVHIDVVMSNILIRALFMVGAIDEAYTLYRGMKDNSLSPDSVTFCTMIHGYCKVGRIAEAVEIFDEFRSTKLSSVACYNCLLTGLCNNGMVDLAVEVFIELNEKDLPLSVGIWRVLMKSIIGQEGPEKVLSLLHGMEKMGPDVYDILCNTAMSFLCKSCYPEAAVQVIMMMKRNGLTLTSKSYYLFIKGLITGRNNWLTLALLNLFLKDYGLDEPRLRKIIVYYLCLKDVDIALLFLTKIKGNYAAVTLPRTLFRQLIEGGRVLDAYKLIVTAEDSLPRMDVFDYTYAVHGLFKKGYITEGIDLIGSAKRKGIILNIVSRNSVMGVLCRQGFLVEAFRLFDSLQRNGFAPSEVTYAILVGALCREGFLLDAKTLFERMLLTGLKPHIRISNSLIDGYCKIGRMDDALKMLYDSQVKGVEPDGFTVSALINGCCYRGDMERALKYFDDFKRKSIYPDFLGFMYLIRGLRSKGRMEECRSIIREMLQYQPVVELINKVDTEVESETLESFIISLCEQGSIKEAVTVLNEVASIFYPRRTWSSYENGSHIQHKAPENEAFGSVSVMSESVTLAGRSDLDIGSYGTQGKKKVKDLVQFNDFENYYSGVALLCSRGELQKASELAMEILADVDQDCRA